EVVVQEPVDGGADAGVAELLDAQLGVRPPGVCDGLLHGGDPVAGGGGVALDVELDEGRVAVLRDEVGPAPVRRRLDVSHDGRLGDAGADVTDGRLEGGI